MKPPVMKTPDTFTVEMLAACGINCAVCIAHLRPKNTCAGCNSLGPDKVNHCATCHFKHCPQPDAETRQFCYQCASFPCARLRQMDKRYRTRYGMSVIANLESLRELGPEQFLAQQKETWQCPQCGGVFSVHKPACIYCGAARPETMTV